MIYNHDYHMSNNGDIYMKKTITVIVPCYNEEEVIEHFYEVLKSYLIGDYAYNLLFVNDGSKDNTILKIQHLMQQDSRIKFIDFSRNFGKESAMYAGLIGAKKLNSDAAIFMDADLQDPPSLIPEMLTLYEAGNLHIYAKHASRKNEPRLKTFFAMMFYRTYTWITKEHELEKGARDFSLLDRKVIDAFLEIKDHKRFTKGIFTWVGFEKKCIEFDYLPRHAGKTKWSFKKLFKYAIDGINQFSQMYKMFAQLIILLTITAIGIDVSFAILDKSFNPRWAMFELVILFNFFILHIVLNVIYDVKQQVLNRPQYVIKNSNLGNSDEISA